MNYLALKLISVNNFLSCINEFIFSLFQEDVSIAVTAAFEYKMLQPNLEEQSQYFGCKRKNLPQSWLDMLPEISI